MNCRGHLRAVGPRHVNTHVLLAVSSKCAWSACEAHANMRHASQCVTAECGSMGIRVHYAPARLISKEHLLAASAKGCGARFPLVATWCAAICWAPYTRTAARGDAKGGVQAAHGDAAPCPTCALADARGRQKVCTRHARRCGPINRSDEEQRCIFFVRKWPSPLRPRDGAT